MTTTLKQEDYIKALEKLKNSPQDRILTLSLIGALSFGGVTFMEAFSDGGVEQISSVISDYLSDDGWFDDNPFEDDISDLDDEVGLFIGGVSLETILLKGISSGNKAESVKNELIKSYEEKINSEIPTPKEHNEAEYSQFIDNLKKLVISEKITQEESDKYLRQVELGSMSLSTVLKITNRLLRR